MTSTGRLSFIVSAALFAFSGCGGPEPQNVTEESAATIEHSVGGHILPLQSANDPPRALATGGPHLQYFGGKVVSSAHVVQVLYGKGTYLSGITSNTAPSVSTFYQQVMNSSYVDWLTEYDTASQKIGRGGFVKRVQIAPASTRDGRTITDLQIEQELSAQIGKGILPAPSANTIYMINFPKGKNINLGGTPSCQAGGFCAYHSTFKRNGVEVYYGVIPDFSPGSGCDLGCGGSTQFNNTTSVQSHELIETITDAEVGLATVVGPPLAWYDPNNGEIGDICNGQQGTFKGGDGHTYTIQLEWSNQRNACIAHK
jgi:hypothetical protein